MLLIELKRSMSEADFGTFAIACGTTAGHLRNVAYGTATANAALARQVHDNTNGRVAAWTLRPDDWHVIWPELKKAKGAPAVKAEA